MALPFTALDTVSPVSTPNLTIAKLSDRVQLETKFRGCFNQYSSVVYQLRSILRPSSFARHRESLDQVIEKVHPPKHGAVSSAGTAKEYLHCTHRPKINRTRYWLTA